MKTIFKRLSSRIWFIVTAIIVAILLVLNILVNTTFYTLACFALGEPKMMGIDTENYDYPYQPVEGADTKATALTYAQSVTEQICEEGFTLLKNEKINDKDKALPITKTGARVSVFGKNSSNMAVGGSGSGEASTKGVTTIFDSLTAAEFEYNSQLKSFYDSSASGQGRDSNPSDLDSGNTVSLSTGETPVASYSDALWSSCSDYKDAAIIVITRIGGEGFDLPRNYLKLDENEKALIDKVCSMNFERVIVLINAANTLELQELKSNDKIDAILWTGFAGTTGLKALGKILKGDVNPSGHTVDTYATLDSNPTWNNIGGEDGYGSYKLKAGRGNYDSQVYYVKYEESVYVGYRYYETAYAEALEGNYPGFDYDSVVSYPFGYGLSYTDFSWELLNTDEISKTISPDTEMTFKVKVTNTGSRPGRDVVQLYVTPPHTHGGIEKSAKLLVGFAKTDVLEPNGEQTVEITIDSPYSYASYDCYDKDGDGYRGYVVEEGSYSFTLSTDAHTAKSMENAVVTASAAEAVKYENDTATGTKVENLYTDCEDEWMNSDTELKTQLSRANFKDTWPEDYKDTNPVLDSESEFIKKIKSTVSASNNPEAASYTMPITGANNGIEFSELIGVDIKTEEGRALWSKFMDQLSVDEMLNLINNGGYKTSAIARLQVPLSSSSDGPVGWVNFITGEDSNVYGTCSYCCETVMSSTWNVERLYDFGEAVGNEGLIGNEAGDGSPYTGLWAPGLNIHRSPLGGRNFEYYSEDSFISGQMAASVIKGGASKGVYFTLKHFAANEQETHRSITGLVTWMNEQSLREVYLKGFEIALKVAAEDYTCKADGTKAEGGAVKAMGVMSSFNRIGTRWTGGDYRLITQILKKEWGFYGIVISDFNTVEYVNERDMFYAGGNLNLQIAGLCLWSDCDKKSAADVTVLRNAAQEVLYTIANSNAYRGAFNMIMPTWQIVLIVCDCAIVVGLALWGFFVLRNVFKKQDGTSNQPQEQDEPQE